MKNAIILHGRPSKEEYYSDDFPSCSNSHWLPWLQKHLLINDILAQTPEMPHPYAPDYEQWRAEFEQCDIGPQTILVGHSCGAGFIVRWLSEHLSVRVGKVALVAPSFGTDWHDYADFFDFTIDSTLANRTDGITIFISDDDRPAIHDSAHLLHKRLNPVASRTFKNHGHFTHITEFPELLQELIV